MEFYERIRALRIDNDLTQDEAAKLICVGQKTYSDYEHGKIRIPVDRLIILAKYYNVDMNYICGLTDIPYPYPHKK